MNLRQRIKYYAHTRVPGLRGWFRYFGTRVYFPKRAYIFELACRQGIYEAEITSLILGLLRPSEYFFDVGSNIGLMSVPPLSQRPDVRVLSFEPSPNSHAYVRRTRDESPWADRWQVSPRAVGRVKGIASFSYGPTSDAGYDGLHHTGRRAERGRAEVEVTTLDDQWTELGRPGVSVVKFDIEGAELEALVGAEGLLRACRPYVVVEWYADNLVPYGHKPEDLIDFAGRAGYEVVAIPTMTAARSAAMLQALMTRTSAFVLVPV